MIILLTNLIINLITTKLKAEKMEKMGISCYYEGLPRGEKDKFVMEVANAIGQSSSNVRLKMKNGRWSVTEIPEIEKIIKSRR